MGVWMDHIKSGRTTPPLEKALFSAKGNIFLLGGVVLPMNSCHSKLGGGRWSVDLQTWTATTRKGDFNSMSWLRKIRTRVVRRVQPLRAVRHLLGSLLIMSAHKSRNGPRTYKFYGNRRGFNETSLVSVMSHEVAHATWTSTPFGRSACLLWGRGRPDLQQILGLGPTSFIEDVVD